MSSESVHRKSKALNAASMVMKSVTPARPTRERPGSRVQVQDDIIRCSLDAEDAVS